MAPKKGKKGGGKAPKAAAQKAKVKKIVEDKTFGMKNKNKSKKVQQYVQQIHRQTAQAVTGNKRGVVCDGSAF